MGGSGPFQDKPSIRVEGLSLARGGRVLFENLSFSAGPGAYIELRGANGSGKTSLLRALAGFLPTRTGAIVFEGVTEPALALHFISHSNALKRETTVRDHVRYWIGLFGVSGYEESIGLAAFGLIKQADLPARALSQGQARRLALMRLHIAQRPIWLLDEPSASLDADGKEMLGEVIESHRLQGGIAVAAVHEALGPSPSQTVTLA